MPHNPNETHCVKCYVQYVYLASDERVCPHCGFSPDIEDEDDALPQDNYNYDPNGEGSWPL